MGRTPWSAADAPVGLFGKSEMLKHNATSWSLDPRFLSAELKQNRARQQAAIIT